MPNQDTLYARWINGDISSEEEKELRASGEWDELETILKMTDTLSLPKYNKEKAYKSLKINNKEPKIRTLNSKWVLGIAASLAVLVSAYFLMLPSHTQIEADFAESLIHTISDGSKIVINDGSSIAYYKALWEKERKIALTGEASFEVIKGVPFIVETIYGDVEVLGTSFNVRAWDQGIEVECYTGKVKVTQGDEESILTQGMAVKLSNNRKDSFTFSHTGAQWQRGMSRFRSENLSNVFLELGRQYNVTVEYEGDSLKFTGGFVHNDINDAIYQITGPLGLDYEIKPNGIVRVFKQ